MKSNSKSFDIIAITETRIKKDVSLTSNLFLNSFSFEFTQTKSSAGGTLLYIADHLSIQAPSGFKHLQNV